MESASSLVEQILQRERQVVVAALVLVAALAWVYTLAGVGMEMNVFEMTHSATVPVMRGEVTKSTSMSMPKWNTGYAVIMLTMWWVMMVGMMLPSATPTILLAAAINRRSKTDRPLYGPTGFTAAGYLVVWLCFSAVAVAAQWALANGGQLSVTMQSTSAHLNGALLLAAGLWQLTPIKQACLRHCRSPVDYLIRHRRPGNRGALVMGMRHGTYCLGCCWFLMALLFVGGIMNLYWIVGLALFVLAEKALAHGVWFGRVSGVGLIIAGTATLLL